MAEELGGQPMLRHRAAAIIVAMAVLAFPMAALAQEIDEIESNDPTKWEYKVPEKFANFTKVTRDGQTVTFTMTTNAQPRVPVVKDFKLGVVTIPDDKKTAKDNCVPDKNKPAIELEFLAEAFERIIPPTDEDPPAATPAAPVAPLMLTEKGGNIIMFWGKMTLQEASGRRYWNGEVHQVITESKATLERDGKTTTYTPKARAPYGQVTPTALPRFDAQRIYKAQFRIKEKESGIHRAIVAYDLPGLRLETAPGGGNPGFIDTNLATEDKFTFKASFSTFFWEDCALVGKASLATHRIDWTVEVTEVKLGEMFITDGKGKSVKDSATAVTPKPPTNDGSVYGKAKVNDPGENDGWDARTGGYDKN
jgi:hypothetical protein